MRSDSLKIVIAISLGIIGITIPAFGATAQYTSRQLEEHVDDYLGLLSSANHYGPLEGAGSHGSLGIGIGVGGSSHQTPEHTAVIDDQLRESNQFSNHEPRQTEDRILVPRVFLHKGLPWPIDIGAGVGQVQGTHATTAGGYIQWTVFERFALPALAVRGKYARLMGLPSTEFDTSSMEAVASYGFFRIFNAYGNYALNRDHASIRMGGETGTTLMLAGADENSYTSVTMNQSRAIGLQVQVIPQFCVISLENNATANQSSWLAKLSVGM